ncbi:MAG: malate dehydrogenase [Planctomycetes bacterium]|nr:malate dehydrogenase [Planctomycetota bacterium]MCH7602712.1 malate dehydrogenase [Planctomycetota bacterium]
MRRAKISIIGGGNVGASCALWAAEKELGDIVVLDIPKAEDLVKGKMLDLAQCGPVELFDANIIGTADYADTAGSDVVIVTAGIPRKPGMSRDDLIATNVKIVKSVAEQVASHSPDAVMIIVSNPLDAMVFTAWRASGFPTNRIVGQAGCLDVARFKTFIAMETGFSVEDINALLLGGHGDTMVPLARYTNISGVPISKFISDDRMNEIIERTKKGGGEIVKLMGTSAYYAPASGSVSMAEAIIKDKKRILPCAAYCDGEYGINGYFVGVPAVLGSGGVEQIIEVDLNDDEKSLMDNSVEAVKELVEIVKQTFPELAEAAV